MTKKTPKKILIIEDETMLQGTLVESFKSEGYSVNATTNAKDAFEMMREDKPDLIMTDLVLFNFDGFEMLKVLKESTSLKNIPVVVLSNLYEEGVAEKVESLGAVDFIVKSDSSLEEITNKVKKILK